MKNWDEIRTAYQVARQGTVSGAAHELGVHHATVIRHIDALEEQLGIKLFQRHARGYTPTEAGQDLMRVAQATDDQFGLLEGRIRGRRSDVSGELLVTSLSFLSPLLTPVIVDFQKEYSDVTVRYLTDDRVFRLEYGEAHVAIRAGSAPQEPDNVVQKFAAIEVGLYVAKSYVDEYGLPTSESELSDHHFVGVDNEDSRAVFYQWLGRTVPRDRVTFRCTDTSAVYTAVCAGAGMGFMPVWMAKGREDLVEVIPAKPEWASQTWLVTHVDLHRTVKVQTFLNFLKDRIPDWESLKRF